MLGKHPRTTAMIIDALSKIGPATTAEVYDYLLEDRNKMFPCRREITVLLPRIPGVRRISPDGARPAVYEYSGAGL